MSEMQDQERENLLKSLGPLHSLLMDDTISEIMINDIRNVIVEQNGTMLAAGFHYKTLDELNAVVRKLVELTQKSFTSDIPYLDATLPDGSRLNVALPPITPQGASITIRKFPSKSYTIEDLLTFETLDQKMAYFLRASVAGKLNIFVSGGTGCGKTTLLNVLCSFVPTSERLVVIEDTFELVIPHANSVRLLSQMPASAGGVNSRELVANSLRMRPDRIIMGECRRAEAFDMLQAMNTGQAGSMTTLHANSPRDSLARLESLCMLAGVDLPLSAYRKQMASALDLLIYVKRFRNGKRRITQISEVTGMEGDVITLQDLFTFEPFRNPPLQGPDGKFKMLGMVPTFLDRLRENGVVFPNEFFNS